MKKNSKIVLCFMLALGLVSCNTSISTENIENNHTVLISENNQKSDIYYDEYNFMSADEVTDKKIIGSANERIYFSGIMRNDNSECETALVDCATMELSNRSQLEAYGDICTFRTTDKLFSIRKTTDGIFLCSEKADGSGESSEVSIEEDAEKIFVDSKENIYLLRRQEIRIYKDDMNLSEKIDLKKLLDDTGYHDMYIYSACISDDDCVYLLAYDKIKKIYSIFEMTDDYKLSVFIDKVSGIENVPQTIYIDNKGNINVCAVLDGADVDVISIEEKQFVSRHNIENAIEIYGCTDEFDVVYETNQGVYGYNYDENKEVLILSEEIYNYEDYKLSNVTLYENSVYISVKSTKGNEYTIFESDEDGNIYYEYPAYNLLAATVSGDYLYYLSIDDEGVYTVYEVNEEAENKHIFKIENMDDVYISGIGSENDNIVIEYVNDNNEIIFDFYNKKGDIIGTDSLDYSTRAVNMVNSKNDMFVIGIDKAYDIDFEKCIVSEVADLNLDSDECLYQNGYGDYDFCYSTSSGIMGYNISESKSERLFLWSDTDSSIICKDSVMIMNNMIFSIGRNFEDDELFCKYVMADEERIQRIKSRKLISVVCDDFDIIYPIVSDFNRENKDFRVEISDYSDYDRNQLNLDMLSGKIPDIILMSPNMDVHSYAINGIFSDMKSVVENYTDRNESFDSIANSFIYDDIQYTVPIFYNTYTFAVNHDTSDWDVEKFLEDVDSKSTEYLLDSQTRQGRDIMCDILFASYVSQYVDLKNQDCNFNDGKFEEILELINENTVSELEDIGSEDDFAIGNALISKYKINNLIDFYEIYSELSSHIRSDISFAGIPSESGGARYIDSDYFIGASITEKSNQKEGAVEFIEYLMGYDVQSRVYREDNNYCPVNKIVSDQITDEMVTYLETQTRDSIKNIKDIFVEYSSSPVINDMIYSDIIQIMNDSAYAFFNGEVSSKDAASEIQSKVKIYLNEIS